jgi:hypothetical protein
MDGAVGTELGGKFEYYIGGSLSSEIYFVSMKKRFLEIIFALLFCMVY